MLDGRNHLESSGRRDLMQNLSPNGKTLINNEFVKNARRIGRSVYQGRHTIVHRKG